MKRKRGFTLIEIIITLSIVVAVALLMYTFFGQGFSLYQKESESADEQMNLRQVMSDITNITRLTDASEISVSGGALTVGTNVYKLENGSVLRNGTAIAGDISIFSVNISENMLSIRLVNNQGTELSTSLSLK